MRIGRINPLALAAISQAPSVKRVVRAEAKLIQAEARRRAPKRTGRLRRSIIVTNHYDPKTRMVEYRIGWKPSIAFYGPIVELGSEHTAARPHLRPAADAYNARRL